MSGGLQRRPWTLGWAAIFALAFAAGCGDPPPPPENPRPTFDPDAGFDHPPSTVAPSAVAPPNPAAAAVMGPCAPGWGSVSAPILGDEADRLELCEPFPTRPAEDPPTCGDRDSWRPGTLACAPVGGACPSGEWPEVADAETALYVRAGAADGDGSMAMPFGTLEDALAASPAAGTVIALAKGDHLAEAGIAGAGVIVRGACAAETAVTSATPEGELPTAPTLSIDAPGVIVEGATIVGGLPGVRVAAADVELRGVVVRGARSAGVEVTEGGLTFSDGLIADNRFDGELVGGFGATVAGSASLTITGSSVRTHRTAGIQAAGDATLTVQDTVIAGVRVIDGSIGAGVSIRERATATLERVALERAATAGVFISGPGALTLRDSVVRSASGSSQLPILSGFGVVVEGGGAAALERVLVEDNRTVGLWVADEGSSLEARDLVIRRMREAPEGTGGRGVYVTEGARVSLERAHIEDNRETGVYVTHESAATLIDTRILSTDPSEPGPQHGLGIVVKFASSLTAERLDIERANTYGIVAKDNSTVTLTDLRVANTRSVGLSLATGEGIRVAQGARVSLTRAELLDNLSVGLVATGGGSVTGTDVRLHGVRERACAGTTCQDIPAGMGLSAFRGGTIELTNFSIVDVDLAAVQIGEGGTVRLTDGLVADSPIGANVQIEGYPLASINERVVYRDNGINLTALRLPIPGLEGDVETDNEIEQRDVCDGAVRPSAPSAPTGRVAARLTNNPRECVPTFVGPAEGEEGHWGATVLEPPAGPFVVTALHYEVAHNFEEFASCAGYKAHRVQVYVQDAATPDETPAVMATLEVPEETGPAQVCIRPVTLELPEPIRLTEGQRLGVAFEFTGAFPDVMCLAGCRNGFTPERNYWSNATAPPYPWNDLQDFGIRLNYRVRADGYVDDPGFTPEPPATCAARTALCDADLPCCTGTCTCSIGSCACIR